MKESELNSFTKYTEYTKFLGMHLDSHLTWKLHLGNFT